MSNPLTVGEVDGYRLAPAETCNLEFKEARNAFSVDEIVQYCIALANEGGGVLLLGINDKAAHPVVGTQACRNPTDLEYKLFQICKFRVEVHECDHPDGRVVGFRIPPRPRGTACESSTDAI